MVDIHQRDIPNENEFDAIREKAEREQLQPEGESARATRGPGSVGGRSGNGQMKPHQPHDDREEGTSGEPDTIVPESIGVDADADRPTQTSGSAIDREVRIQEKKQQHDAGGRSGRQGPGMDPPPGAPVKNR